MKKMNFVFRSVLIIFTLLFIINSSAYALLDTAINYEKNVISVFSYGESYANANGVRIYFRCQSKQYYSSREAFNDCNEKCRDLISRLKGLGILITEIETSDINLVYRHKNMSYPMTTQESSLAPSDKENKDILCLATQDIRLSIPFATKEFGDILVIEDLMLNNQAVPINPWEFGIEGFGYVTEWFGEKNNLEYTFDNKDEIKNDAIENAIAKARAQALHISYQINKNIVGVHSVQYIDDKEKIIHLWGSYSPVSIEGDSVALDRIKYQIGIIVNFTIE